MRALSSIGKIWLSNAIPYLCYGQSVKVELPNCASYRLHIDKSKHIDLPCNEHICKIVLLKCLWSSHYTETNLKIPHRTSSLEKLLREHCDYDAAELFCAHMDSSGQSLHRYLLEFYLEKLKWVVNWWYQHVGEKLMRPCIHWSFSFLSVRIHNWQAFSAFVTMSSPKGASLLVDSAVFSCRREKHWGASRNLHCVICNDSSKGTTSYAENLCKNN